MNCCCSSVENSSVCTALDMPEWREITDKMDWWVLRGSSPCTDLSLVVRLWLRKWACECEASFVFLHNMALTVDTIACGLYLGRSEALMSLRHYLQVQRQRRHTIDRLEERGVERGSARRSSLKGRERAFVTQTNTGTALKATLGKLLRETGWSAYGFFGAHWCHLELNWSELQKIKYSACPGF